jgi:hypothetical protein
VYNNAIPVSFLFIFGVAGNIVALIALCCSDKHTNGVRFTGTYAALQFQMAGEY